MSIYGTQSELDTVDMTPVPAHAFLITIILSFPPLAPPTQPASPLTTSSRDRGSLSRDASDSSPLRLLTLIHGSHGNIINDKYHIAFSRITNEVIVSLQQNKNK